MWGSYGRLILSTFIITAQIPLSRIQSAARVVGASGGAVRDCICGQPARLPPLREEKRYEESRSAERHGVDEQQGFFPRVLLSQTGIRHVIKGNTEAAAVREPIIEFGAAAKLPPRAEIEAVPAVPVAAGDGRV